MPVIIFVSSLLFCGLVLSTVDSSSQAATTSKPDYHYVPYAGDAFGA